MHATDGDAAGVGECRNDHYAVGGFAGFGGNGSGDDVRLQRVVATEGGVAAADESQAQPRTTNGARSRSEGVADNFLVAGCGFGRVQAAGVGQDVDGGLGLVLTDVGEGPGEVLDLPAGEYGEIRNGLRACGVVVEDNQNARGGGGGRGYGVGYQLSRNLDFRRESGQSVCFKGHCALHRGKSV